MSSVRIDASGQRALSSTINSNEVTSAQLPTKSDDNINVQLGNCAGLTLIVPLDFKLTRVRSKGGSEYLLLSGAPDRASSLAIYSTQPPPGDGVVPPTPHATLSVGKHIQNPYLPGGTYAVEEVEVIYERVGDLIPPTE